MAKRKAITPDIKNTVIEFARFINSKGISVRKLIIFGSYAKGKAKRCSDIDLCIVSPNFGRDSVSELQFLLKQSRYIDDRIEPIPVSVKEYKEESTPLVCEIKKFGREILFR